MDRGYLDFARLFVIHEAKAFFVTRAKSNTKFKRRYSHPVARINTTVICDQTGVLTTYLSSKDYPTTLRRVVAKDDKGKRLVFLTNNFALKPALIAIDKKRLHLDHHSLYEILQILRLSMFETIPINQLLRPPSPDSDPDFEPNQLALL